MPACGRSDSSPELSQLSVAELPGIPEPSYYDYRVLATYPHDPEAFTQGLTYVAGYLYESTGLYGRSGIRRVELETGAVLQSKDLPDYYFGEGIAVLGQRLYQLTWRNQVAFLYDLNTFARLDTFAIPREGWGLTHDGSQLIASDGTPTLYFLDPESLEVQRTVTVRDHRGPVEKLNELEWVAGEIMSNVWKTDRIARICPYSGTVTGWIDLTGLLPPEDREQPVDVLNGIAYDTRGQRLFVTGKLWPKLFQIELVPRE